MPNPRLWLTGTFFVTENLLAGEALDTPTSAEIVDVSDPATPSPLGALDLGGSPGAASARAVSAARQPRSSR